MSSRHEYEYDVYLSYVAEDDEDIGDGKTPEVKREPCVSFFRQMLTKYVGFGGHELTIADAASGATPDQAAAFIAVLSSSYVGNQTSIDEVAHYLASHQFDTSSMFTVFKEQVKAEDILDDLRNVRSYRLYGADPQRPLIPNVLQAAVGLAKDLPPALAGPDEPDESADGPEDIEARTVFLAHVETSLGPMRERLRTRLEEKGFRVLPEGEAEADHARIERRTRELLDSAEASIHLFAGEFDEAAWVECDVAMERSKKGELVQYVWTATKEEPSNRFLANLLRDVDDAEEGVVPYRGSPPENFQSELVRLLTTGEKPAAPGPSPEHRYVFLLYAPGDAKWTDRPRRYLKKHQIRLLEQLGEDERPARNAGEIDRRLERFLSLSSACLVVYGDATASWLEETYLALVQLEKAGGLGVHRGFCLFGDPTGVKIRWDESGSDVIKAIDKVTEEDLEPFIQKALGARGPV